MHIYVLKHIYAWFIYIYKPCSNRAMKKKRSARSLVPVISPGTKDSDL